MQIFSVNNFDRSGSLSTHACWQYPKHKYNVYIMMHTILNLILRMEKNKFNFEKRVFLVKVVNCSIYINIMRTRKTLIYCVKLDHALYSINYGRCLILDY